MISYQCRGSVSAPAGNVQETIALYVKKINSARENKQWNIPRLYDDRIYFERNFAMVSVTEVIFKDIEKNIEYENLANTVMQKCFEVEKINPTSLYVCITLTTPENIRQANSQYRGIDKETDVLSFPIYEKEELDKIIGKHILENWKMDLENGIGQEILGDIIISISKVQEQAKEYGHSFERELAYMLVHGFYHLRGYDHMVEEEKKVMREKEERVLQLLSLDRK